MAPPFPPIAWETVENAVHDLWFAVASGIAPTSVIWYGQNQGRPADPFIQLKWGFIERVGIDAVFNQPNPLVFSPVAFTASSGQPLAAPNHGLALGDGPVQLTGTASPLAAATDYWAVPVDAGHVNLATSFINARNGVFVAVTGSGSGTIVSTSATVRAGQEVLLTAAGPRRAILDVTCFGTSGVGSNGADQILEACRAYQPLIASQLNAAGLSVLKFGRVTPSDATIDSSVFEPRAVLEVTLMLSSQVQVPTTIIAEVLGSGSSGGATISFDTPRVDPS